MSNKILTGLVMLVSGTAIGGATAYGLINFMPQVLPAFEAPAAASEFMEMPPVMAPLVDKTGKLVGYGAFEIQYEVPKGEAEEMAASIPVLLDAINMRTYRAPLAGGTDSVIPSLGALRKVLLEAGAEVYGKERIRSVAITRASPV